MSTILGILKLCGLAWREEPRRLVLALVLMLLQAASLPLAAGFLGVLTDGALGGELAESRQAAIGVAACVIASLTAGHFAHIFYFELGERLMLTLQRQLIELANGSPGIEHHERPEYSDRFQVLRQEVTRIGSGSLAAVLGGVGLLVAMVLTALLLGRLNLWLLLLPLASVPPLLLGRRAEALLATARTKAAQPMRRARHLLRLSINPAAVKELQLCRLGVEMRCRQNKAWEEASNLLWNAELRTLGLRIAGQIFFATAYGGAMTLVIRDAVLGHRTPGDVLLTLALAVQVNLQVAMAITLQRELYRTAKALDELESLRSLVRRPSEHHVGLEPPKQLTTGICFNNVTFSYPGTSVPILENINLSLKAGSTVALVGESGSGKSSLVKLLCGFYNVEKGSIEVDGCDLRRLSLARWHKSIAATFQDFVKFEFRAREAIGVGNLPEIESSDAVVRALELAGGKELLEQLENGLETQLGNSNPVATELSGGQWQKLALARSMMRKAPLLVVLDEPTSALDAEAEQFIFERHAQLAKRSSRRNGAITVLVSHRLSAARNADQIVVMANKRIVETGNHQQLIAGGGLYSELYALQASAYQVQ